MKISTSFQKGFCGYEDATSLAEMRTPKGREFQVQMCGNISYIKKDELQLIFPTSQTTWRDEAGDLLQCLRQRGLLMHE